MKLKILPLVILLLPLLIPPCYAQTPPESLSGHGNDFGIDVTRSYPGETVLELMEAAEAEIDAAVNEAYAKGYKTAMMEYAPGAVTYKAEAELLRVELEAARKKNRWFWPVIGGSAGLSFVSGFFLHSALVR